MTIRAGYFGPTQTAAVTDDSASIAITGAPESRHAYLFSSDVTCHLHRTSGPVAAEDATTDDMRVPANTPILVNFFAGDFLSYVIGDAEDDGTVWLTKVDH